MGYNYGMYCEICNSEFKPYNSRSKYCTRECYEKGRRLLAKKNRAELRGYHHRYWRKRSKTDNLYKLTKNIRSLITVSINKAGYIKGSKTETIIGCKYSELLEHLTKTFENRYKRQITKEDKVHIDHIKPLCTAKTEEELLKLNHFSNLQWLLAKDNLKKGSKLNWNN